MKLAMIGLGKMGANMVRRLIRGGHQVVGFNRSKGIVNEMVETEGMIPAATVEEAVQMLTAPAGRLGNASCWSNHRRIFI